MKIESVTFRNFGSYGNKTMTLALPENPSFFLISAKNGQGKSTLSDVIKFGIYGKLENKKLKDIANRLNKNAYVKIILTTNKGLVEIERGIEPGLFNLKVDGKAIDKAGKRSVQEYLEEEILEMPFYVFSNTLSLSINDFKSFLRMSNFDKKAIVDKIFGFQVLNQMREILKYQTKKLKENVDDISTSIAAFQSSLDASNNELTDLENRLKESTSEKKLELLEQKEAYSSTIEKGKERLQKIDKKISENNIIKNQLNESIGGDRQLISTSFEKIQLYKNSKCPTCSGDLHTDFHKDLESLYQKTYSESVLRFTEKEQKLKVSNINQRKLDSLKAETTKSVTSAQVKLRYVNSQLSELGGDNTDYQTDSLKNMMADFTSKIKSKKEEQNKNQKTIAFYNLAEEILGEKGVKQLAIKTILPPLNSEISKLTKSLGIEHRIVFNEEFDAKLTHFGIEVSPDSLSTGEMKKIDFAVLLSVIRMMKLKYPLMNMIFLDEIFSSLDGDAQYHILKILRNIVTEYNMNILIISHYPLSYTEFDYHIDVVKTNGFSSFEIIKSE